MPTKSDGAFRENYLSNKEEMKKERKKEKLENKTKNMINFLEKIIK